MKSLKIILLFDGFIIFIQYLCALFGIGAKWDQVFAREKRIDGMDIRLEPFAKARERR